MPTGLPAGKPDCASGAPRLSPHAAPVVKPGPSRSPVVEYREAVASLQADRARLAAELAAEREYIRLLEDEIDSLRWTIGLAEVPV